MGTVKFRQYLTEDSETENSEKLDIEIVSFEVHVPISKRAIVQVMSEGFCLFFGYSMPCFS